MQPAGCEGESNMGFAIKKNSETADTELWIDGMLHASWAEILIPESSLGILSSMLEYSCEHGKTKKEKEIRKALGILR